FQIRIYLRRHWLSVTLGVIAMFVLALPSYDSWRFWNIPWAAPYPASYAVRWAKALVPGETPLRLAVLPFASSAGDPEAETLTHGLSGDIANALGRVSEIREFEVIGAASVLAYGPNPPDLRAVARDLKVQRLLLGSVQQSGNQL